MLDRGSNRRSLAERWAETSDRRITVYSLLLGLIAFVGVMYLYVSYETGPSGVTPLGLAVATVVGLLVGGGDFLLSRWGMRWRRDVERRDKERYGDRQRARRGSSQQADLKDRR